MIEKEEKRLRKIYCMKRDGERERETEIKR